MLSQLRAAILVKTLHQTSDRASGWFSDWNDTYDRPKSDLTLFGNPCDVSRGRRLFAGRVHHAVIIIRSFGLRSSPARPFYFHDLSTEPFHDETGSTSASLSPAFVANRPDQQERIFQLRINPYLFTTISRKRMIARSLPSAFYDDQQSNANLRNV